MSFTQFGWPLTLAGMITLAGIVFLLQRLRAQRRVLRLPTAALWAQALRDTPVRVLGGRFRYWLAYLLVLAIALLLWFAAAHPQVASATSGGGLQRFYLDNSALMTGGGDLARAKRALLADVRTTPADRREVILGDAVGTRLLVPGESVSLLSRRLDMVSAEIRPSTFATWAATADAATVHYYGAWGAARAAPHSARLRYGYLANPVPDNRGIVALGVTPAASGQVGKADLLVTVAAADRPLPTAAGLRWTENGRRITPSRVEALGDGRFLARDMNAAGEAVGVALAQGDGFAADDKAAIRVADRRPIKVALLDGTPPAVRAAVTADPSLTVVPAAEAQVVVGNPVAVRVAGRPGLMLSDASAQTFTFAGPDESQRGPLAARLDALGLAQLDAGALADALHRPVGVDVRDARQRRITAWRTIFAPASPFVQSPAMPVFVSRSIHWLGQRQPWRSFAQAGDSGDPLTVPMEKSEATVSLTDRATTLAVADTSAHPAVANSAGIWPSDLPFLLLLLAAGVLLGIEWWLVQRRVIP
ncbi:hypothetical protein QE385_000171 [Sphingomonas sp. SORGH_AS 950]|uniref:hypothetical protein n=1 Tax=Sphingomonas sp. SORGH_AS_0950 TaxID=3041792 RepID=UPI00277F8E7F|nr:hypothetical protein [Sphingomonas sp. SORGH_AS_0950]MDQ1155844.1 hypothetical protein [Sphingomonas sp. SORGH_AS_0950]